MHISIHWDNDVTSGESNHPSAANDLSVN